MKKQFELSKRLHEMTKEEAIAEIIRFIDPEVVGANGVCMTFHLANPDIPCVAFKLRDGVYSRADITLEDIHVDGLEANSKMEVSTREAFLAEMHKELEAMTLPALLERVIANQTLSHTLAQLNYYKDIRGDELLEAFRAELEEKVPGFNKAVEELESKQGEEE